MELKSMNAKVFRIRSVFFVKIILVIFLSLFSSSCKKLVETEPPSIYLTGTNVFSNDATAIAVLNGIYINLNANGQPIQGVQSISLLAGLGADELKLYDGVTSFNYLSYYKNQLTEVLDVASAGSEHWSPLYNYVFKCNAAIEGLEHNNVLTPIVRTQLLGEAKFLRAFFYFYLVNLFGDVPLALTTDPEKNTLLARSHKEDVYKQIVADLQDAENNLSEKYLNETLLGSTIERVRPTKWAAASLLARVYLYLGEWGKAETKATFVINNNALFELPPLNNVFLKNSRESIWQLQPTDINFNTVEAQVLVIPPSGPNAGANPVYLSDTLLNSFEPGDLRAKNGNWVDTTIFALTNSLNDTVAYANKYKLNLLDTTISTSTGTANLKEYFMMLRLAEQYLIRAEARAQLGNINGGIDDLNTVRSRAFSPAKPTDANNKETLLARILHERQVELFMEWGHRWLDLKRVGQIDNVMNGITPLKSNGDPWMPYQQWYPLPLYSDLRIAPNLVQNEGYN